MQSKSTLIKLILGLTLVALAAQVDVVHCQIFDQMFSGLSNNGRTNAVGDPSAQQVQPIGSRLRDIFNVNVPFFYDMVKNGSSMGINVLSGLVRVDRNEEAVKSGLTGPRPLSVRVFGIPVYERGQRVRSPNDFVSPSVGGGSSAGGGREVGAGGREVGGEDEELPVY